MSENSDQSQFAARLARAKPMRDLAHSWYALSVACRRIGAMIERAAKEMLYESANDKETTNGEPSTTGDVLLSD